MDRVGSARLRAVRDRRGRPAEHRLSVRLRELGVGDNRLAGGRGGWLLPAQPFLRRVYTRPSPVWPGRARGRHDHRGGLRLHLPVRDRVACQPAFLRPAHRGGSPIRNSRRPADAARDRAAACGRRMVAGDQVRQPSSRLPTGPRRLSVGPAHPHRNDRRLACRPAAPKDRDLRGAGRRGRAAS